ncbi:MAG: VTC domain-containing protein [Candidatus Anammoxibacter sp.]
MKRVHYQKAMPPVLQRYEMKFVIPEYMIKPISDFVSVYCSLDKYSVRAENGFYRITNLYLDSPNYLFLTKRIEGCENRFNMRIRTYGDTSGLPCFLEIKQKCVDIVKKYRAIIHDEDWSRMFEVPGYKLHKEKGFKATSNKMLFFKTAYSYKAEPKVLTQYMRKAYVSDVDDYSRVTFDTELQYQPEEGYNLVPDENKMVHFDNEILFDPECNVVLELKCYPARVPLWMIDLVRHFDLRRRGFSKYVTGVVNVLQLYRYDSGSRQVSAFL